MVDKAISVLFHLRDSDGPQGVTAVADSVELPKSSVHRLLTTLARRGLVERDERGRYSPGFALVSLGLGALEVEPVVAAARNILEVEAQTLGETVFLVGPRAGRLVVLDKVEGTGFLRAAPRIGSSVPAVGTAAGKLFMAFEPSALFAEATEDDLDFPAPAPEVPAERIRREVARARKRGFAENREEWIPGLWVVGAPVFESQRLVAVLAVAAPSFRLRALGSETVAERALSAAREIGARLDGSHEVVNEATG